MTKISQLTDIGTGLAPNDEFIIRDVSDASTPNKKVTASGFFIVASALGLTGLDRITNGTAASGTQLIAYASGVSGYTETTITGVASARTTISGYFENASGVVGGVFYPVVTQIDIGSDANQISLNGMLGTMAFQNAEAINVDQASISQANVAQFTNVPLLTGGGIKFPAAQVASADPNTLDDYEEGTWTPIISDGTNNATAGPTNNARYTKIGNRVLINCFVETTSLGSVTGSIRITGLPFTSANVEGVGGGSPTFADRLNITAGQALTCSVAKNSTIAELFLFDSAAGVTAMQASEWSSDGYAVFCIQYMAA